MVRKTRTFPLFDDDVKEANEMFKFELSNAIGAEIAPDSKQTKLFILNDDDDD